MVCCGVLAAMTTCALSVHAPPTTTPEPHVGSTGVLAAPRPAEPPPPAEVADDPSAARLRITPFLTLVGGLKADSPIQPSTEHREGRVSTIALSDFGLRGSIYDWLSFESELMANGGTSLHGTSAFEGQAALQVRKQLVRVSVGPLVLEAGRVVDEASVDFVSAHAADSLLQDIATRDPLLYSGYNLGNGVRATIAPIEGLRLGLAFNAGNPVSTTGSLMIGGSFPPFDRFYYQPWQAVPKGANHYPDDTFHIMMLTPSVLYDSKLVQARVALQGFVVDTNTTTGGCTSPTDKSCDDNIKGYNVRGNVRLHLLDDLLSPFVNATFARNDTVDPTNVNRLAPDKYQGVTLGGGLDLGLQHRFAERSDGFGVQFEQVQYQVGGGPVTRIGYLNVGATWWASRGLAVGARVAYWQQHQPGSEDLGERALFLTLRLVVG
ncbi:MAG: hypothetical protein NVS3B10_11220 [Polyangiales bacterium]